MALNFTLIYGSVRSGRQGIKAVRFLENQLQQRGHQTTLIDPLEYTLPLLDKMYKEYKPDEAPLLLQKLAAIINDSDGFLIVSGEYNHGIPPALKNLLDHFLEEWAFRPSAIACYSAGQFGGVRAAMQLRMTLGELGMSSIPSLFPIPKVQDTFQEDGTPINIKVEKYVARFLDEFEWYARALKNEKAKGLPY